MSRKIRVAVCGATGAVGREMVKVIEERRLPVAGLRLLASERSAGQTLEFAGEQVPVEVLGEGSFTGIDIALFSAGADVSRRYAPLAARAGAVVVDNTSAFRLEDDVPLVVPEVNSQALERFSRRGIVANPNCSTIQLVVVLKPLERLAAIRRVVVSTYQSVSGAGQAGVRELEQQCLDIFNLRPVSCNQFPRQIAFTCLPHIGDFRSDGYSVEEHKMMDETRKILERPDLRISATTVRVPVFYGHSEAVNLEFAAPVSEQQARAALGQAPGVRLVDDLDEPYPTNLDAVGGDDTLVGRLRRDPSLEHGLDLWIVADNLRKGAALNAVQIAELLLEQYL